MVHPELASVAERLAQPRATPSNPSTVSATGT